jgi:CBS domain containing-hemolysin-like protein
MVPRPDILALELSLSFDEAVAKLLEYRHSRLPVYEGSIDHIRGVIYARDLLRALHERQKRLAEGKSVPEVDWHKLLRPAFIVPETKRLHELLHEFLERRLQLALGVDEFGSISGLITLEDVLEQIVGEIRDEYEEVEMPVLLSDGAMVFDATLNIRELEGAYEIRLPRERGFETIAGFVVTQLGFIPQGGESFVYDGLRFTVVEMDRRRVARVKIERVR